MKKTIFYLIKLKETAMTTRYAAYEMTDNGLVLLRPSQDDPKVAKEEGFAVASALVAGAEFHIKVDGSNNHLWMASEDIYRILRAQGRCKNEKGFVGKDTVQVTLLAGSTPITY